ncbi:restriction endonuclease subunit S [Streptomyces sp. NPDC056333]|uniref:restriction endonuclease subunit S n=1 Tax=Streptomyces sp. NPDC056333 TaxID=3345786 RepID=UPI0035DD2F4B
MTDAPPGWVHTTLGEIAQPSSERQVPTTGDERPYLGMEGVQSGTGRVTGFSQSSTITSASPVVSPGYTLYGRLRPNLNKVTEATYSGLCSGEFITFPPQPWLARRFLMYRLLAPDFVSFAISLNAGDRPRVKWQQIAEYPILLPPLAEQVRIVSTLEEHLSRLDSGTEAIQRSQHILERLERLNVERALRDLPLSAVVPDPLDVSASDPIFAEYEQKVEGYELPSGWSFEPLDQLVPAGRKPAYGVLVPGPDTVDGVPFVRVGDLVGGRVKHDGLKRIRADVAQRYPRTTLSGGELLLSLVGTIGRAALATERLEGANVARAIGVFPLDADRVDPRWVLTVLQSGTFHQHLERASNEVARKTLNLADARRCPIPLPPKQRQVELVEEVSQLRHDALRLNEAAKTAQKRAEHLRLVVLTAAFKGRLTEQDSSEAPAGELLNRARRELRTKRPRQRSRSSLHGPYAGQENLL